MGLLELHWLSVSEASAQLRDGSLSPVELVDHFLERITALNPALNALLTVMDEQAREEAQQAADALARGEDWGPLHGIPIAVKDLIDVAGVKTTAGSDFLREHVATEDSAVVQRLRAAGAIIIGKAHLHEFAVGATNVNPHYGPARNPWNTDLSPGGSSGGSGAAVAAGLCTAALGTDTGGSVRVPSALCGLTGLRPPLDAIALRGVIPMSWTLDTVGPMAHTAQDCAILYDSMTNAPTNTAAGLDMRLDGLRLGVITGDYFWAETSIEVRESVQGAVEVLRDLGLRISEVTLPDMPGVVRAASVISLGDAAAYHKQRLDDAPERFGEDVRARLEWGRKHSAADYARARQTVREWRMHVSRLFRDDIDLLVMPVAPSAGHIIAGSEGLRAARELLRFTYPVSVTGMPVLSLPCGFSSDGLPLGFQLIGQDAPAVLQTGHAYQKETTWHQRHPDLKELLDRSE